MNKDWYDKYGKKYYCATCRELTTCVNRPEPLFPNCCEQYLRDRIAELEEQLKNAIVPKFKGEDVAFRVNIFTKDIERVVIVSTKIEIICNINISYTIACLGENQTLANIDIRNIIEDFGTYISQEREEDLFTTKEEAQAKLEELKGENK
jgi:hypothetical protein